MIFLWPHSTLDLKYWLKGIACKIVPESKLFPKTHSSLETSPKLEMKFVFAPARHLASKTNIPIHNQPQGLGGKPKKILHHHSASPLQQSARHKITMNLIHLFFLKSF